MTMTITTRRWDIDLLYFYPRRSDLAWYRHSYYWCRWLMVPFLRVRRNIDWPCYQLHIGCLYFRYWYDDVRWSASLQQLVAIDPGIGVRWPR